MRSIWVAALLLAACSPSDGQSEKTAAAIPAPWNDAEANTQYQPAFAGQTRAPALRSDFQLNVETIAEDFEELWALEFLPDGSVIVTEKPGRMRIVGRDGTKSEPIQGLPAVFVSNQGGLLDVALSPNFATDRMLYWSYSEARGGGRNGTSVARGRLSDDSARVENVQVIFRQEPAWASDLHYGSRLVFNREGQLFVTLGERSNPEPRVLSQDLGGLIGKVVRINADGTIPSDNPFVGREGARPEIWSYGHRNVQGATLHPETGQLWTIEHGPRGGDELNRPQAGLNYGWPVISYGIEYGGPPIGEGLTQQEGMEQPLYYWDPVIAPGGMTFYRGDLFEGWRGNALIASLSGALVRLELDGDRVVGEERVLTDQGRIRDVVEAPDGALWLVTDDGFDRILRVTPASN